ncbi:MAG TPA: FtsX-like permease family protein [Candidatus Competibacter sp.]|nr:FtsX-like permease family protein [Candidatus Competibacter sp.]HUM95567.1 FtsX-like permease family protein [Candidatus Competibacter sp.]
MMNFIKLGWRNILKNRRRSLITVLAVALGFASINLFSGYIHNVYDGLAEQAIRGEGLGHLTLMKPGLLKEGKLEPEKFLLKSDEIQRITGLLSQDETVRLVTPRLAVSGIVSNGKVSTIFLGEGMVPEDMAVIRGDFRADRGGALDRARPAAAAFASDLADMLGLKQNDYAVLVASTVEGLTNALDVDVGELYNTGNAGTNDKMLLLPFAFAQRLYDTEGADRLIVLLRDRAQTFEAQLRLSEKLRAAGLNLEIKTWLELSSFYKQVKGLFDMIFAFIFAIVIVIVMMSIINTMSMAVVERTREIGTLRALGMRRWDISWLFSVEGVLLVVLGGLVGVALTLVLAWVVNQAGFSYVPPNNTDAVLLQVDVVPWVMLQAFLFLGLVAALAALLPARRAARMVIVDAMGHV